MLLHAKQKSCLFTDNGSKFCYSRDLKSIASSWRPLLCKLKYGPALFLDFCRVSFAFAALSFFNILCFVEEINNHILEFKTSPPNPEIIPYHFADRYAENQIVLLYSQWQLCFTVSTLLIFRRHDIILVWQRLTEFCIFWAVRMVKGS